MATPATIRMFNGDVITVENTKSLIHVIADEYKVNATDVQLEHLGEEIYFGWIQSQPRYRMRAMELCRVFVYDVGNMFPGDFSKSCFGIEIDERVGDEWQLMDGFEVVLDCPTGKIAMVDEDQFEIEFEIPSNPGHKGQQIIYRTLPSTTWFKSLHECMTIHEFPEEMMEMTHNIQHRMYMNKMESDIRLAAFSYRKRQETQ